MNLHKALSVVALIICWTWGVACVESRCIDNDDCLGKEICGPEGRCILECVEDKDCATGFVCEDNTCRPPANGADIACPEDMVPVANAFCVDRHQASRPDATETDAGTDDSRAVSVEGVIPWEVDSNSMAEAACAAVDKRLCTPQEWRVACRGPNDTRYSYGDEYDPTACNGIDTFCNCEDPACVELEVCPYPRCWNLSSSTENGGPCGADYRVVPTGSLPRCTNGWGVYDINGNLWEHVGGGSDQTVRGGAYDCADSAQLHQCDYIPGNWAPTARGFRCCRDPLVQDPEQS